MICGAQQTAVNPGRSSRLIKRGMAATLEEWLLAAEYNGQRLLTMSARGQDPGPGPEVERMSN